MAIIPLASARFRTCDSELLCEALQGDDRYILRLSNHFGVLAEDAVDDAPTVLVRFEAVSEVLEAEASECRSPQRRRLGLEIRGGQPSEAVRAPQVKSAAASPRAV